MQPYKSLLFIVVFYHTSTLLAQNDKLELPNTPENQNLKLNEENDVQILQAVQNSMIEYNLRRAKSKRIKRSIKRVCYDDLGCFEDSGPFSYLEMLPSPPNEINTKFYFYSAKKRSERPLFKMSWLDMKDAFQSVFNNDTKLSASTGFTKQSPSLNDIDGFDEMQIKVIVHGFGSACPHVWIYEMKTALMAVENCIVICVDWENGATLPNYVRAATNTRLVGKQLAMLLKTLKKHKGLDFSKTHIIGFSLGAHVAGFAGAEIPGLNRITGLDPAGPLFEAQHPKARLDTDDANFVDVIHSNGENLILGGLGSWQPMGDVDFYPNGGRVQNGCSNLFVGAVTDFIWSQAAEIEGRSLCNHRRAYKFFIDSVAPRCLFPAFACSTYQDFLDGKCFPCDYVLLHNNNITATCGNMGYYANKSTGRGQLYLVTREEEPFCAHQFKLEIYSSINELPLRTIGKIEVTLEGEGGLNETFLVSEKEDTEFFAGQKISKIIVPHPALGFPDTIAINYKSYSGWLSKGLLHWDIDKISLTDSFGKTLSFCSRMFPLKSGIAAKFELQLGDCELIKQIDRPPQNGIPINQFMPGKIIPEQENISNRRVSSKNILTLGNNYMINNERDLIPDEIYFSNNSNSKIIQGQTNHIENSSKNLKNVEIFEPVLKNNDEKFEKGRNIQLLHGEIGKEIQDHILEIPELKQDKISDYGNIFQEKEKARHQETNSQDEIISVPHFPFNFSEFIQRAERYARETIFPIISEQAPKLLGFMGEQKQIERKPRHILENKNNFEGIQQKKIVEKEIHSPKMKIPSKFKKIKYLRAINENSILNGRINRDLSKVIDIAHIMQVHVSLPIHQFDSF